MAVLAVRFERHARCACLRMALAYRTASADLGVWLQQRAPVASVSSNCVLHYTLKPPTLPPTMHAEVGSRLHGSFA